jgi:hypothetical protein
MSDKYEHEMVHHDPSEGYDATEPAARQIWMFVVVSVITLVAVIFALQSYFNKIWNEAVYEKVLSVPGEELGEARSLEAWRLSHYEYADADKKRVRIPYDRAKELFLKEYEEGKTFYPGKPTEPKPEEPDTAATAATPANGQAPDQGKQPPPQGQQAPAGKQAKEGKQ